MSDIAQLATLIKAHHTYLRASALHADDGLFQDFNLVHGDLKFDVVTIQKGRSDEWGLVTEKWAGSGLHSL